MKTRIAVLLIIVALLGGCASKADSPYPANGEKYVPGQKYDNPTLSEKDHSKDIGEVLDFLLEWCEPVANGLLNATGNPDIYGFPAP